MAKQSPTRDLQELLHSVLSKPTAPFRESWVVGALRIQCQRRGVALFEDEIGNLWAGAQSLADVKKSRLVFVAHMDHPGFIIQRFRLAKGKVIADAKWLGGGPTNIVRHHVKVFSHFHGLLNFDGIVRSVKQGARSIDSAEIEITSDFATYDYFSAAAFKKLGPWGACLWYGKDAVEFCEDHMIATKAADDLVGICALVEGLAAAKLKTSSGVTCLFSRAEESGFHGALAVLEKKWLNPDRTAMISVETSSVIPGVEMDKGPVVRLGDRATVFDPGLVKWIQDKATRLAGGPAGAKNPTTGFQCQRKLMDGGSCEASAFNVYGFTVAGLSVPLGGYHNIGPNNTAVPEVVSLNDVSATTQLITEIMKSHQEIDLRNMHARVFRKFHLDILKNHREHRQYFVR